MTAASVKNDKPKATKRQQRQKGPNPSNTWQQQPKIKSMEARERAKLRSAGFTKSREVKQNLNPDADFINSPEYKFGRLLASPVARTRHATILKLTEYLKARTDPNKENGGLSVLDLMKLWKGMWHTLYLCDGAPVQEEVSKLLAELIWSVGGNQEEDEYAGRFYLEMEEGVLGKDVSDEEEGDDDEIRVIEMKESDEEEGDEAEDEEMDEDSVNPAEEENVKHCRGAHLSALYVRTFFRTLTREWSNMDKYRIDKFYTLSRLVLREVYRYMSSRHWNLGIIRLFNDALFEEVLRTTKYGNGVRFHILDICLEELAKVNAEEGTGLPLTEATFLDALEPFFALAQRVDDKIIQKRAMDKVIMKFLEEFSVVSDNYETPEEGDESAEARKNLVMDQVHVGTVGQFIFELASDTRTADRYRKGLYDMHKTYLKRIKAVGRDVDINEDTENDEEMSEDGIAEEEAAVVEEKLEVEPEPKKSKKKKKKSKDKKDGSEFSKVESSPDSTKKVKTSAKKRSKKNEPEMETEEVVEVISTPKKETPSKKKKKKSTPKKEIELTKEKEEIITISKKKQKAAEVISTPKKETPSKKRKKSKSKKEIELTEEKEEISTPKKETPSKKKKKSTPKKEIELTEEKEEISTPKKETPSKKKKKSTPKKEIELTEEEEEIITISKKEQKAAGKAATRAAAKAEKASKAKAAAAAEEESSNEGSKKVKFGKTNQSKSYKASMKDMKKIDAKSILNKTPEKSILLKKQPKKKRKSRG